MNNLFSRKTLKVLIAFIVIILVIYGITTYLGSFGKLSISIKGNPLNSKVKIYKSKTSTEPILEYSGSIESVKLKKGVYRIQFSGDKYKSVSVEVNLQDSSQSIDIVPTYSEQILSDILNIENSKILSKIQTDIPLTKSEYSISGLKLYFLGEWCSAKIHISQTPEEVRENYVDTFRIILKKEGDDWKLITNPPELLLSDKKYPNIPRDILVDVNKNPENNTN